ncbi:MAG: hypothetical protein N3F66_03420 [Spirochaetes bacterium]|nr:hypothetical protein [Spirochaetota bacterium]
MEFETTTCVKDKNIEVLEYYAHLCDLSVSKFIVSLINYAAIHEKKRHKPFSHIKYRERHIGTWKRLHLCLSYHEYEFLLDMKKLWKMSVAFLIEYCIENILIEFVETLMKEEHTYSYRFMHYTFDFSKVKNMPAYRCIWGLPPEMLTKT